jgi:hypothetical protein
MGKPGDGGPAFPRSGYHPDDPEKSGMSLRDYFAGQALAGLLACEKFQPFRNDGEEIASGLIASNCYEIADAMLAARKGD